MRVLDDVSLELQAGEATVVLGRSGTGKSVLLKHIVWLLHPDAGHVFLGDQDITALTLAALSIARRQIGFLFQNAALFDLITIGENVAFPLRRHTRLLEAEVHAHVEEKLGSDNHPDGQLR